MGGYVDCGRRPREGVAGTSEASERANHRDVAVMSSQFTTTVGKASEQINSPLWDREYLEG
jgi:hypothetical protein